MSQTNQSLFLANLGIMEEFANSIKKLGFTLNSWDFVPKDSLINSLTSTVTELVVTIEAANSFSSYLEAISSY